VGKGCKKAKKSKSKSKSKTLPRPPPPSLRTPKKSKSKSKSKTLPRPPPPSLRTPSPKILGQQVLQFFNHPEAEITELGSCLQDIIVEDYLARGAYGAVYAVRYKGKDCVMKIVVEESVKLSGIRGIRKHPMSDAQNEADTLRKASDLGIGPKLYDFRICKVKIPYVFGEEKIRIGIFILERLVMTLGSYYTLLFEELEKLKERNDSNFEKKLSKANSEVRAINEKIKQDCYIAQKNGLGIYDMHPENIMFTKDRIPIISDWGMTGGYEGDCDKYFERNIKEWNDALYIL
jgi:hypothetical protein